jgi:Bacterial dnaA protein helix-turn-helix
MLCENGAVCGKEGLNTVLNTFIQYGPRRNTVAGREETTESPYSPSCSLLPVLYRMYLAKHITEASFPEIGRHFGGKHHATLMHSIPKIDELRCRDATLNKVVENLLKSLTQPAA